VCADVPLLKQIQCAVRESRRKKTPDAAGGQCTRYKNDPIDTPISLKMWAARNALPATYEELRNKTLYAIPMDENKHPGVTAVAVTMKPQIGWIEQLRHNAHRFVIHMDGKWKLHKGEWLLITAGVHSTEFMEDRKEMVHSFRPLVYLFTKNHETAECTVYLLEAFKLLAKQFYGFVPQPGAGCADHGQGLMTGFKFVFPSVPMLGCWPHVAWHLSHGLLLPLDHPLYDEVSEQIHEMHTCHSLLMFKAMKSVLKALWGDTDPLLKKLWRSLFDSDRENWAVCHGQNVPQALPSNQEMESWHAKGIMKVLSNQLNQQLGYVLRESLVRVAALDGNNSIIFLDSLR